MCLGVVYLISLYIYFLITVNFINEERKTKKQNKTQKNPRKQTSIAITNTSKQIREQQHI